ncbi:MAG: ribbon-helix-helix domain-containing protein [Bacteroidales bacterium]|jgi:metal-responsive CopG/Arc/MetJ family transcriptional regulator|nr:ribbon-helix-helix domain-containing protein [Bacteroidales bacterium]
MTVHITFQDDLPEQIDQVARAEARSRSELIRNAARIYIERQQTWQNIFRCGETIASKNKFDEADVMAEIKQHRRK